MGKIRCFLGYAGPGIILVATLGLVVLAPSHWLGASTPTASGEESGWKYIIAGPLLDDIKVLASDKFEGRAPATEGEKLTLAYLQRRFKEIGLEPGNPNGTYFQKVPMVGITADPSAQLVFTKRGSDEKNTLKYGDEFVAWTKRMESTVHIDAPLVFVGYGVVAPEYHWDDYKDVAVKGKILVMLVNDPAVPDPHDPSQLNPQMFKGKAMTYYGRWTYKYEIAAKMGAAGALVVHETGPAGYPWSVVKSSNTGEQFDLVRADRNRSRCPIEGWITRQQAARLFQLAGKNFDSIKKSAASPNFHPVSLGVNAGLTLHNRIRTIDSYNVVGKVVGSDPELRNQYVIYTAHWDHLGIGAAVKGDRIYNGAVDNASGVGGLLELANAFAKVQPRPKRSILFLSVTAEEKGLWGSEYYAENPLYPLASTLANINMDVLNVHGRTRDIGVIGLGMSSLDDIVKAVAKQQGRVVKPDAEPEKGFYYRSDHFEFAKQGVPALDTDTGTDFIGRPPGWGLKVRNEYTTHLYHTPFDEVKPDWDLSGAVEDLRLLFSVGYRVANASKFPTWSAGSEFRAKRQQMLRQTGASK
jgi:Zn-dependent M28 family amino/carboxypeptidase